MTATTSLPESRPSLVSSWVLAARPKTLSAASVPVVVGSACAFELNGFRLGPALAALGGALLLQIGANFANDVYDYEKGADTAERLGPTRAVQAGLISPAAMKRGMFVVFGLALLLGAYLTAVAGPVILAIGVVSILSAIAYTGGPYPLGYNGLGDLFVFVFFGLVAVPGTVFVQLGQVPTLAVWCALPVGALATAILVVNNLRDHEQDERVGKRTLAVRWGPRAVIYEYGFLLALSYAVPLFLATSSAGGRFVLLPLLTLPLGRRLMRAVATEQGRELNARLAGTAKLLLLFGLLFALGIVLDHLRVVGTSS
ncbi:MAG TPA: 1,4-dihydroxy-2-naphthoate polyprenyltransferase [Polyangiaceae bacterium]|nr:1,4-dihydroxy-2-naphthoate polyprenyltransferase [Polyangiaceae bacterium]